MMLKGHSAEFAVFAVGWILCRSTADLKKQLV